MALKQTGIDAASFTAMRLISGVLMLWLIVRVRGGTHRVGGTWFSAAALFAYAAGFSFAYLTLPTGVGALILFGAVQGTMIGYALWSGERLRWPQVAGLLAAFGGLAGLLLPGLSAPPLQGSILMLGAGVAWGVYSLRGRNSGDPLCVTAGNFLRAVPFALGLSLAMIAGISFDGAGICYAVVSGALASGLGYVVWYSAVTGLQAATAAAVQLSVPVLAAAGGVLFLGEPITLRLLLSSLAILGGLALFISQRRRARHWE
jgi:drug/metabolite transporter (DMT)-like permease